MWPREDDQWASHRGWQFIINQGLSDKFYPWAEKYSVEHGQLVMEALAEIYINARPKLKALYTASLVAQRMEK